MPTIRVSDKQHIRSLIEQGHMQYVQVGLTDLNGVLRGKCMSAQKFLSALDSGFGFCDVVVATDIDDQLCAGMSFTGWHSGYPDAVIEVIAESGRSMPYMENMLFFLTQFAPENNQLCPRGILKKVVDRARTKGIIAYGSLEYEFTVFQSDIGMMHQQNFQSLKTMTPANCGYSVLRSAAHSEFYQGLLQLCENMDMPLEGLHTEIGPGVLEAALAYDTVLEAADKAILFKTFTKVYAQRNDLVASFMAKWNIQHQGQSGHTHISLRDEQGAPLFHAENEQHNMSKMMRHFLAGQQRCMPELLAMVAPSINSYARLVPGFWAPTQASWGVDNRTCALRVINSSPHSQRVEYRVPGADTNAYLAMAVALASGLYGIENELEPTDMITGNAYTVDLDASLQLPRSLSEASARLYNSAMAREYFGEQFVDDYTATRDHEVNESQRQVTDWQLRRYFECA
jgi:glutamine synthetase